MYQYEDPRAGKRGSKRRKDGHGSFSDIAFLEQLGVKAFNWASDTGVTITHRKATPT